MDLRSFALCLWRGHPRHPGSVDGDVAKAVWLWKLSSRRKGGDAIARDTPLASISVWSVMECLRGLAFGLSRRSKRLGKLMVNKSEQLVDF